MLDQIKYMEAYHNILGVAKNMNPKPANKDELKKRIISHFRYIAAQSRSRRYGSRRFHSIKTPAHDLITKRNAASVLNINSIKDIVLEKIINQVASDLDISENPASPLEMNKCLVSMKELTKRMEIIAGESSGISKDLQKIPKYIETGSWE